ncbi:uncharacterized protein LOC132172347 [Corylus avellana]|uniref:uncharacterized protein LOC132172229 n=1 Tax=Corylus avellana TaxID=13451 RepID=UPI001E23DC42|nr:uncharacterized protein LOC132172229 [Corylus avellana]XP_059439814.1 uncharacterized protein LOC132172347 [Corylus avellana]
MRPPPSLHSNFFSSLKQVEKRLKLEEPSQPHTLLPHPLPETEDLSTESLGSPIYLHFDQSASHTSTLQGNSEPPQAFLSSSPQTQLQPDGLDHPKTVVETENDAVDDIQRLIQLLDLSDCEEKEEEAERERGGLGDGSGGNSCDWEDGFYAKIVGFKGPKCRKEVERLEGWIEYFMNGCGVEERREPLRLAYLLLGKAAFVSEGADCGVGGLEFPSSIVEFLQNDPPKT